MSSLYTIGFTKKPAQKFFNLISDAGVSRVIDVRLNNTSQLSAFAKSKDLAFFLKEICGAGYEHFPDLAPTQLMLKAYKSGEMPWEKYENLFLDLMSKRNIERGLNRESFKDACLLCSEHLPHQCHRRLVGEYLNEHWGGVFKVVHLK